MPTGSALSFPWGLLRNADTRDPDLSNWSTQSDSHVGQCYSDEGSPAPPLPAPASPGRLDTALGRLGDWVTGEVKEV